jgi:hypothetical protein
MTNWPYVDVEMKILAMANTMVRQIGSFVVEVFIGNELSRLQRTGLGSVRHLELLWTKRVCRLHFGSRSDGDRKFVGFDDPIFEVVRNWPRELDRVFAWGRKVELLTEHSVFLHCFPGHQPNFNLRSSKLP